MMWGGAVGGEGALQVLHEGSGPRVVMVHGSIVGAERTWRAQRTLAGSWSLCMPSRPGFGSSAPLARGDFEAEAPAIAALLGEGAHLVGHSYGAVIALYAAALRPGSVRSLVVSEPGCLAVAAGDAHVDRQIERGRMLFGAAATLTPLQFLTAFRGGVGSTHRTPGELSGELLHGVRMLMSERPPWEADPPLEQLRGERFPKLVISGAHSPVFEAVCDRVAERIGGARERVAGRAHTIPATGEPYNLLIDRFMRRAEAGARGGPPGGPAPI